MARDLIPRGIPMTITLSPTMEQTLKERADRLQVPIDEVVEQALSWYMAADPELMAELRAWEEVGLEAIAMVEDSLK